MEFEEWVTLGPMSIYNFERALLKQLPPDDWPDPLVALWWDAKGNWKMAHEVVGTDETPDGAWVHAYLHRKEGDLGNANYWYREARKPMADGPFENERVRIVDVLLTKLKRAAEAEANQ